MPGYSTLQLPWAARTRGGAGKLNLILPMQHFDRTVDTVYSARIDLMGSEMKKTVQSKNQTACPPKRTGPHLGTPSHDKAFGVACLLQVKYDNEEKLSRM